MKSNCCKGNIYTKTEDEGTSYWVCGSCGKACDPVPNKNTRDNRIHKEGFDAGYKKGYKDGLKNVSGWSKEYEKMMLENL